VLAALKFASDLETFPSIAVLLQIYEHVYSPKTAENADRKTEEKAVYTYKLQANYNDLCHIARYYSDQ